jgi:hypothetical protein
MENMKLRKLKSYLAIGVAVATILGTISLPNIGINNVKIVKADELSDAKAEAARTGMMQPVTAGTGDGLGNYVLPTLSEVMKGNEASVENTVMVDVGSNSNPEFTVEGGDALSSSIGHPFIFRSIPAGSNTPVVLNVKKGLTTLDGKNKYDLRVTVSFVGDDVSNGSGHSEPSLGLSEGYTMYFNLGGTSLFIGTNYTYGKNRMNVKYEAFNSASEPVSVNWLMSSYDDDVNEAMAISQFGTFFKSKGNEAGVIRTKDFGYMSSHSLNRKSTYFDEMSAMMTFFAFKSTSFSYFYGLPATSNDSIWACNENGYVDHSNQPISDGILERDKVFSHQNSWTFEQGFGGYYVTAHYINNNKELGKNEAVSFAGDDYIKPENPAFSGYVPANSQPSGPTYTAPETFPVKPAHNIDYYVEYIPINAQSVLSGTTTKLNLDGNPITKDAIQSNTNTTAKVKILTQFATSTDTTTGDKTYYKVVTDSDISTFPYDEDFALVQGTDEAMANVPYNKVTVVPGYNDPDTGDFVPLNPDVVNPGTISGVNVDDGSKIDVDTPGDPQKGDDGKIYIPKNPGEDVSYTTNSDGTIEVPFVKASIDAQPVIYGSQDTDNPQVIEGLKDIIKADAIGEYTAKIGDVTVPNVPLVKGTDGNYYRPMTDGQDLKVNIRKDGTVVMLDVPFQKIDIEAIDEAGKVLPEIDPGTMTGINSDYDTDIDVITLNKDQTDTSGNTWRPLLPGKVQYPPDENGVVKVPFTQVGSGTNNNPSIVKDPNTGNNNGKNLTINNNYKITNNKYKITKISPTSSSTSGKVFPKTSDTADLPLFCGLGASAVILLAIALILKRRKSLNK